MKARLFFLVIALFGTFALLRSENPERTILYTLNENEILVNNEYALSLNANSYRSTFVITDDNLNRSRLFFDGQVLCEFEGSLSPFSKNRIFYVNPDEAKGYIFSYSKDDKYFFNNRGIISGPYDDISFLPYNDKGIAFKEKEKWYEFDGNTVKGPFTGGTPGSNMGVMNSKGDYIFQYYENDSIYFNYNNNAIGPFVYVDISAYLSKQGNFMISYPVNDQWFVRVDNKVFGPYLSITNYRMNDAGDFAFIAEDLNNKTFININGENTLTPGTISKFEFSDPSFYAFTYNKEGGEVLSLAGKEIGEYKYVDELAVGSGKKFKYLYGKDDDMYMRHNNKEFGPYKYLYTMDYNADKDELTFYYTTKTDVSAVMKNGISIDYSEYEKLINSTETTSDPGYTAFKSGNKEYNLEIEHNGVKYKLEQDWEIEGIKINNQHFGKANSLNCWYDNKAKAFVWLALEEKELVLYKYSL